MTAFLTEYQQFKLKDMIQEETKALLNKLEKRFEEYENKVYEEIAYMNKHGFKMEVEALSYKADAYNRCKLDVFEILNKD